MNERVRSYLIEVAKHPTKFVTYSEVVRDCNLGFDLSTESGKHQLSAVLGEVSTFEDEHDRPLISAMAIYKNPKDDSHGDGFFKVAEQLKKGSWRKLKDGDYAIEQAKACQRFWQVESNYLKFAQVTVSHQASIEELFERLIGNEGRDWRNDYIHFTRNLKVLRKTISEHPTLTLDDGSLYEDLDGSMKTYAGFMRRWLFKKANGIASKGQSTLSETHFMRIIRDENFKAIAKSCILTPTLSFYNLLKQWWANNKSISNNPLLVNRALAACNPEALSSTVHETKFWRVASVLKTSFGFKFEQNHKDNWFAANMQLSTWLDGELSSVLERMAKSELDHAIWRNIFVWLLYEEFSDPTTLAPNQLFRRDKPIGGLDAIPDSTGNFEGVEVDYEKEAKERKDLGDAGEELVMEYEKQQLLDRGMVKEAESVRIVTDGMGYDVLSFDENGNERYIEVKTTTGRDLTRFFLTLNEVNFMRKHNPQYCIFRVYHYDEENNSGEFFEINGEVYDQLLMQAIQFKVWLKK